MTRSISLFAGLTLALSACSAGSTEISALQILDGPRDSPRQMLIWHGWGEVYRMQDGSWTRVPEHDYELTVVQRRYSQTWASTKHMSRAHPGYDGSAGDRFQTHEFRVEYDGTREDALTFAIRSTLGDGNGRIDPAFREGTMVFSARVSRFAPFDTYRIEQRYDYEGRQLRETVTLIDGGEAGEPWVKIEERATLFSNGG